MSEHTKTPWNRLTLHVYGKDGKSVAQTNTAQRDISANEANAAFIVRAANSHEALVAVLEAVQDAWNDEEESLDVTIERIMPQVRAALAGAKE
jgi:hypothetical protein